MVKTIAFHISLLFGGGAERVVCNLANEFAARQYKVYLITSEMEDRDYYELDNRVERIMLPKPERGRIRNAFERIIILRNAIKKCNPDVVVSFQGKTNLRAIIATRFLRTKVIVSVRSVPTREYGSKAQQALARFLFCFADGAVFQTEMARDFFGKIVQKKSCVLMNPLVTDYVKERYEGERLLEIVTVGRLHEVKNHELVIRAFDKIKDEFPGLVVRIYGEGEHSQKLTQLIKERKLEDRVVLEGYCNCVSETIWKSQLFILSSNMEGMPNALLEAMALGIPVISTDCPCGGPRTLIQDGINGLLVPVNDDEAMANAIRRMLNNPSFATAMGREAAKVKTIYAPEKVYSEWEKYIGSKTGW